MVPYHDIQPAKMLYGCVNQCPCSAAGRKLCLHRDTTLTSTTLSSQLFRFRRGLLVIKHNACAGLGEHPHNRGADPARSARNDRNPVHQ
jgi:hypothetical protein